ncbi:hypothetical protein [Burkholderia sp. Ac-20349]|uniref:hypothetical protein n=1 Tax=Burkholderia sp. Ac-20349 TaxID=2703893 RepID=UPI001F11D2E1|nr:hypothetical protein [Burkholderia sp. Ac-20349]
MENTSIHPVKVPASDASNSLLGRVKRINRLFALTVLAPTVISTLYYGLFASDIYISESRFVVRSAQQRPQTSVIGALLSGSGFSRAQDDSYPVIDFIESRDALRELNANDYIRKAYSDGDLISRFHSGIDNSFEALWRYYGKHIATVTLDATSGIGTLQTRAYRAEDAERINEDLLQMSERLVNRMNDRAAKDTVAFSQNQVEIAMSKAKDAATALATYRNSHTVFDPDHQSTMQLQQVSALQTRLFAAQTQLAQLELVSPQNPQIPSLKTTISSLQEQINNVTGKVAGSKDSLSQKATTYARLQLDSQFADRQLTSAMAALENAKAEAERKQLYLERLVQPNTPDVATEPKRLRGIATTFVLGFIVWATLSLLIASIREHRD